MVCRHGLIHSHKLWKAVTEDTWDIRDELCRQNHEKWPATTQREWKALYAAILVKIAVLLCHCINVPSVPGASVRAIYVTALLAQANWKVLPAQKAVVRYLAGHTGFVTCLAASAATIASGSADQVMLSLFPL